MTQLVSEDHEVSIQSKAMLVSALRINLGAVSESLDRALQCASCPATTIDVPSGENAMSGEVHAHVRLEAG